MLTPTAWLAPHIPTLLVDSFRGHRTGMLDALAEASSELITADPVAIVVVSARWQTEGPFLVDPGRRHRTLTDHTGFGVEIRYDCTGAPGLARALVAAGTRAGVRVATAERGVDSGVAVPLQLLLPDRHVPVVPVSVADRPDAECRAWGAALRKAIEAWPGPVAFVVGGLLSFDAHAWRLSRTVAAHGEFDERVIDALRAGRWDVIPEERLAVAATGRRTPAEAVHVEGELRHLEVLRGFLGSDVAGDVRCYESGPGVGAALVAFPLE